MIYQPDPQQAGFLNPNPVSNVNYYIKIVRVGNKTTFHIQQGRSETDIAQQPEEGYPTKEAARLAKTRMIRQKVNFTFRKELRKK